MSDAVARAHIRSIEMKNKYWKYGCLLLLAVNIAVVGVIGYRITRHRDQQLLDKVSVIKGVNKVTGIYRQIPSN